MMRIRVLTIATLAFALVGMTAGCKKEQAATGDVDDWGQHASMVLDSNGTPHVAFYHRSHQVNAEREETVGALVYGVGKVSGDTASFRYTTIDGDVRAGGANVGQYTSLALDAGNNPHITYYDKTNGDLKYAWYDGKWNVSTVDDHSDSGQWTSLVLTSDGQPRIAYYDAKHGDLKFAYKNGDSWWRGAIHDGEADVGQYADLKLDAAGNSVIAYYDKTNGDLLLLTANGTSFDSPPEIVDSVEDVGRWPSLVIDGDTTHITYEDYTTHTLKYASRPAGGAWTAVVVDGNPWVGADSSLVVNGTNLHIAYFDGYNNDLKYAEFDGQGWMTTVIAGDGGNGYFNTLALGPNGTKNFAFYSFADTNLNYVVRP